MKIIRRTAVNGNRTYPGIDLCRARGDEKDAYWFGLVPRRTRSRMHVLSVKDDTMMSWREAPGSSTHANTTRYVCVRTAGERNDIFFRFEVRARHPRGHDTFPVLPYTHAASCFLLSPQEAEIFSVGVRTLFFYRGSHSIISPERKKGAEVSSPMSVPNLVLSVWDHQNTTRSSTGKHVIRV